MKNCHVPSPVGFYSLELLSKLSETKEGLKAKK
jgi:hypothetical protein